jgi:hypothetical protein
MRIAVNRAQILFHELGKDNFFADVLAFRKMAVEFNPLDISVSTLGGRHASQSWSRGRSSSRAATPAFLVS